MINRQGVMGSVLACGFTMLVACGSDKPGSFIGPGIANGGASATGNRSGSAGSSNQGGSAGRGGAAGAENAAGTSAQAGQGGADSTSPAAPVIEITTPPPATDPNGDTVLVDDQVTVLCTVEKSSAAGAKPVNPSTVKIAMLDAGGKLLKTSAGSTTGNDSEYSATFVLAEMPSGRVSFSCSAEDTAQPVHSGLVSIDTLVDQGPEITAGEPADKSAHNLLGPMNVEFDVAPLPIAPGDKQATVSDTKLQVGGVEIETVEKTKGHFQAFVDFSDKSLFNSPPTGFLPISISASSSRKKPGKATRTASYGITLDGVGPVISLGLPAIQAVIGRASVLTFNIQDAGSGVDRSTVAVKLNEETKFFSSTDGQWTWEEGSGSFSFKIGTALAKNSQDTQVTVNVLAKDKAGNASTGNSRIYNLDNQPPIVDLDPADVFEQRPVADGQQCSDLFDPLGEFDDRLPFDAVNGSPNDQSTIVNFGRFRSLVWDETNTKPGQGETFLALTDKDSVRLYVQANTDSPLLADDDKDGICDEIWTGSAPHQLHPTDKPLPFLKLIAVPPTSAATMPVYNGGNPPNLAYCRQGSSVSFIPLCSGVSDMSVVIRHSVQVMPFEPVVYAVEPDTNPNSVICTGKKWDVASAISAAGGVGKLGWVCIAARALDNVGNPGVSAPLRVCLDDGTNPDRCKDVPPPSCTDNCTPPPHFAGGLMRHF
jgi:hypothetical protein